jgi:hypothetical protein
MIYSYSLKEFEFEQARHLFKSNALGEWLVPLWTEGTRVSNIDENAVSLSVDTNAEYTVGGKAIIWQNCYTWLVVDIADRGDGFVLLEEAVGQDIAEAIVMPLRTCIVRNGLNYGRLNRGMFSLVIEFEATDNPNLVELLDPMQVTIALDTSGSMSEEVEDGFTRLDLAKLNMLAIVDFLRATGRPHDVHIIGWNYNDEPQKMMRFGCSDADYVELRTFVETIVIGGGTHFAEAFEDASIFYSSGNSGRQIFLFITDGEPAAGSIFFPIPPQTITDEAVALRDAIPNLEVYGFNIDLENTFYTDQVDNTGGAQVVNSTDVSGYSLYDSLLLAFVGVPGYRGIAYYECAGPDKLIEAWNGAIYQVGTFIDSGIGRVAVEPVRTYVNDTIEAVIKPDGMAKRFAFKRFLHFLGGGDRPFYVPDYSLDIIGSTTTSIIVRPVQADVLDWIGQVIVYAGQFRSITNAEVITGDFHELTVSAFSSAPAGSIQVLRKVRQIMDQLELQHVRDHWLVARMVLGAA